MATPDDLQGNAVQFMQFARGKLVQEKVDNEVGCIVIFVDRASGAVAYASSMETQHTRHVLRRLKDLGNSNIPIIGNQLKDG